MAKERKRFFFEKKNQKTSIRLFRALPGGGEADGENVFVSFFKKKRLLPLPPERSMMSMVGMIGVPILLSLFVSSRDSRRRVSPPLAITL